MYTVSTAAYEWAPKTDKHCILQVTDRMEPIHKKFTDLLMTKRLQTLQSIDEGIEKVKFIYCSIHFHLTNAVIQYTLFMLFF